MVRIENAKFPSIYIEVYPTWKNIKYIFPNETSTHLGFFLQCYLHCAAV